MSPRGEQFSGILLVTHVPRLWPYCLSVRDERAIYPRGHCHDQKEKEKERKSSLPFLSCTAWEIKFHFNPGNELERRKDLEGNEDGWGGDYRWVKIFFSSFSVFFILFIAAWKFICKVRCKVFTSGFYIVDKKQSMCAV